MTRHLINIFARLAMILLTNALVMDAFSQISDVHELRSVFRTKETTSKRDFSNSLKNARNEIDLVISSSFLFYQSFVSSQDKPSCVYTPSCFEYSVDAFQKKGLLLGWMMTFDRRSRCHRFVGAANYPGIQKKYLVYDPVK